MGSFPESMMIRNFYFVVGDQNKQTNKPGEDSNRCQK